MKTAVSSEMQPTHAGGIVYRMRLGSPEFLLVTARRRPDHWVYPKGHIDPGETPEEAAVREVEEESGVHATIVELLEDVTVAFGGQYQVIRYFLMSVLRNGASGEGRRSCWLPPDEAMDCLTFPESRASLTKALVVLGRDGTV